jgi:monoamine oxidase
MNAPTRSRREFLAAAAGWAGGSTLLWSLPATRLVAKDRPRVLVLGAGLAGLRCALRLEAGGCEVTILEARDRPGGRLHTLYDVPGRPEAGGSVIGRSYRRMVEMAEMIGAKLETPAMGHGPRTGACKACHAQGKVPDRRGGPGSLIAWRDRLVIEGDWIDALPELTERERSVAPDRLLASYLQADNPLQDAEAWSRPEHADLDQMSLAQYLQGRGATATALQLMNVAPNCPGLQQASAVWALRDAQRRAAAAGGLPLEFPSGSTAFVTAMVGALRAPPLLGHEVTRVTSTSRKVVVHCRNGSRHEADFAVCTLPLPVLRRVVLEPMPSTDQLAAFREIAYTPITRVYYRVRQPFWERDGLPVTMWTDSVLERVFALRDAAGEVVALVSHADGPSAVRLDSMDPAERHRHAERELARLRPATRDAVEALASTSWANDPFAGGAYPYYQPGQVGRLRAALARPLGRLHFAGEHTAVTQPGMEGAAESADRAVAEVLARIG